MSQIMCALLLSKAVMGDEVSCLMQRDPRSPPDSLQAPVEGGEFSKFFNNRLQGHGIHKWLQYFEAYDRHFQQFVGKEVHIMEIGIQSGGSLDMWKGVFGSKAHVYGIDLNPKTKSYEDNRTKIFIGDQADPTLWENVKKEVPRIDILIDDGGHTPDQQTGTLGMMLEYLSPNGIYVAEDVHGEDNLFWQGLKLNQLESQKFHFKDLGQLVNSVHVYPYLLVIERADNLGKDAMHRQLGLKSAGDGPSQVKTIATSAGSPRSKCVQLTLRGIVPGLDVSARESVDGGCVPFVRPESDLSRFLLEMPPKGWLVARNGDVDLSDRWGDQADAFFNKAIKDFKMMHQGGCCHQRANLMQQSVDSLHFYPNLLIAQRTDENGKHRLMDAPRHGSSWIPYGIR